MIGIMHIYDLLFLIRHLCANKMAKSKHLINVLGTQLIAAFTFYHLIILVLIQLCAFFSGFTGTLKHDS